MCASVRTISVRCGDRTWFATGLIGARRFRLYAMLAAIAALLSFPAAALAQSPVGSVTLTPGWATFGQALPQGAATGGLQVGSLPTQTDVKTTWPDGSIRFAVVTVNAPSAATYQIVPASASSGSFSPALPAASVELAIGGVTYTASLPGSPSSDRWLSGPLAYEGRSVVAPVSSADASTHPF